MTLDAVEDAVLVAGSAGLRADVSDVLVFQDLNPDPARTRGLLVVDARSLVHDTYQLDIFIRVAHDHRAAGLIFVNPGIPLGAAALRLADDLGIPTYTIHYGDTLDLADKLRANVFQLAMQVSTEICRLLPRTIASSRGGLAAVISTVASQIRTDITLVGRSGSHVAGAEPAYPLPSNVLLPVPIHEVVDGVHHLTQPVWPSPSELPSMWLAAQKKDANPQWDQVTASALGMTSLAVSAALAVERLQNERDARTRLGVLNAITTSTDQADRGLTRSVAVLGWETDGWCSGIEIDLATELDAARDMGLTDALSKHLADAQFSVDLIERRSGWTFWDRVPTEPATTTYKTLTTRLRVALTSFSKMHHVRLYAGIGRPYYGLRGLRSSLAEAHEAATIALASAGETAVHHIDELGVRRILSAWYASDAIGTYSKSVLGPLLDADASGNLLTTLETYLDFESSCARTGVALNIHRNTVQARVEKTQELLGVDINDPDERLALQLAIRAARITSDTREA